MSLMRGRFHYYVRGLAVEGPLLGAVREVSWNNTPARIAFPISGDSVDEADLMGTALLAQAQFPPDQPPPQQSGRARSRVSMQRHGYGLINVVRVEAERQAPFGINDVKQEKLFDAAFELLHSLRAIADELVCAVIELTRTRCGQCWLGLGGEEARGIGDGTMLDVDANESLPLSIVMSEGTFLSIDKPENLLSEESLSRFMTEKPPGLAETLLADAAYYAEAATPKDPARAVFIAAAACEIAVRARLRAVAPKDAYALLEVLIDNPRDHSVAAAVLFHKVAKAVSGRSLHEDDPALFRGVTALFAKRNGVAHRGERPTQNEAEALVQTAFRAFSWLRTL